MVPDCRKVATTLVDLIAHRFGVTPAAYDRDLMVIEIDYAMRARYAEGYSAGRDDGRDNAVQAIARRLGGATQAANVTEAVHG